MGARCSNNCLISCLNAITLIIGICMLLVGIHLSWLKVFSCNTLAYGPLVGIGALITVMSLFGLVGACCRATFFMWLHLFILFVVIVVITFVTGFGAVVMMKGPTDHLEPYGGRTYHLNEFSMWLQDNVVGAADWPKLHTCMLDIDVCEDVMNFPPMYNISKHASPTEVGCCMPPAQCGYVHPTDSNDYTVWKLVPKTGIDNSTDANCSKWDERMDLLCFGCDSCKAGFLAQIRQIWINVFVMNLLALLVLSIIFSCACRAFRTNRRRIYYQHVNASQAAV